MSRMFTPLWPRNERRTLPGLELYGRHAQQAVNLTAQHASTAPGDDPRQLGQYPVDSLSPAAFWRPHGGLQTVRNSGESMKPFAVKSLNQLWPCRYDSPLLSTLYGSIAVNFLRFIPSTQPYNISKAHGQGVPLARDTKPDVFQRF